MSCDKNRPTFEFAATLSVSQSLLSPPDAQEWVNFMKHFRGKDSPPSTCRIVSFDDSETDLPVFNDNPKVRLPVMRRSYVYEEGTNISASEDDLAHSRKHHLDPDEILPRWESGSPASPANKKRPLESTASLLQEDPCCSARTFPDLQRLTLLFNRGRDRHRIADRNTPTFNY